MYNSILYLYYIYFERFWNDSIWNLEHHILNIFLNNNLGCILTYKGENIYE